MKCFTYLLVLTYNISIIIGSKLGLCCCSYTSEPKPQRNVTLGLA